MEQKKKIKTILIALLLVGGILGLGYEMSTAIKPHGPSTASASTISETPMVPANFSDLAEKVRSGVVNVQVVKKVKNIGFGFRQFWEPIWGEESFRGFLWALFRGESPWGIRTTRGWFRVCYESRGIYSHQ